MITTTRVVVFAFVAALVVFCIVQDRVTAAGAREYVRLQRAAVSGTGHPVTVDEVMKPAVRRSVREGLLWSVVVMGGGLVGAVVVARRSRRE
jgi:hypothetical protein